MPMIDAFLGELSHEAATTRRLFERVPEDKMDWRPHEKSMPLSRLAGHIAELPGWSATVLHDDAFDLDTAAEKGWVPARPATTAELASPETDSEEAADIEEAPSEVTVDDDQLDDATASGETLVSGSPPAAATRPAGQTPREAKRRGSPPRTPGDAMEKGNRS